MRMLATLPWMDLLLVVTGVMAVLSFFRLFFPDLAGMPIGRRSKRVPAVVEEGSHDATPESEDSAQRTEQIHRNLVEEFFQDADIGILFFDDSLRLRSVNRHATFLLDSDDIGGDCVIGRSAAHVLPPSLVRLVQECRREKRTAKAGGRSATCDTAGEWKAHAMPLRDEAGEFYGVALFVCPLVLRSGASKKVQRDQTAYYRQLASVGVHAAGMAHEIKNPLVALKAFAELLPSKFDDPEFRGNFSKLALSQIQRIEGIVNDLLDYARPKRPVLIPGNPLEILREALEILAMQMREKKIQVRQMDGTCTPTVLLDVEQMRRVFLNVLANAIEAMPQGGNLAVSSSVKMKTDGNRCLEIMIKDTGAGIAAQDLERIFEPFFTTKKKGSGLGLAISKRIVEDHQGDIEFKSTKKGAQCVITLPMVWTARQEERPWNGGTRRYGRTGEKTSSRIAAFMHVFRGNGDEKDES